MDDQYKPRAKSGLERSQMGSEILLYSPDSDKVTVLNETAAAIWELCDGTHSLAQILVEIEGMFDAPPGRDVESDVNDAIEKFKLDGILED
ncbi:PqqD family protein [bacterium]|nr:PqqD family protein [bacterium]